VTITAWRIIKATRIDDAFTGEGTRRFGGRWSHRGTSIVYTASSLSLAALEILVHLEGSQLLQSYAQIPVEFAHSLCRSLDLGDLPPDWSDNPPPVSTKNIGTEWANSRASVVLAVPSAIVPDETVFLVNPRHPEFSALEIGNPSSFRFDPRLLQH
jgi:RES domain-containing protein